MQTSESNPSQPDQKHMISASPSKEPANDTAHLSGEGAQQAAQHKETRAHDPVEKPSLHAQENAQQSEPAQSTQPSSDRPSPPEDRVAAAVRSLSTPAVSVDTRNADSSDSTLDTDGKTQDAQRDATPLQSSAVIFNNASVSPGEASADGFPAGIDSRQQPSTHTPTPAAEDAELRRAGQSVSPL